MNIFSINWAVKEVRLGEMDQNTEKMDKNSEEIVEKPRTIPKSVWFLLFYGLCERYCLYGFTGKFSFI